MGQRIVGSPGLGFTVIWVSKFRDPGSLGVCVSRPVGVSVFLKVSPLPLNIYLNYREIGVLREGYYFILFY